MKVKDDFAAFQERIFDQLNDMEDVQKQQEAKQLAEQLISEVKRRGMDVRKLATVRTLDELRTVLGLS